MWSIQDGAAPIVAEFYKYMINETSGDSGGTFYALHGAVTHLRARMGEDNFASWVCLSTSVAACLLVLCLDDTVTLS